MNDYKFGNFIYTLRSEKGISQEKLGEIAGVSNSTVSKWENGKSIPPMKTLKILSEYFGVTSEELLNGERAAKDVAAQPIVQPVYIPYYPLIEQPKSQVVRILMILLFVLTLFSLFIGQLIAFNSAQPADVIGNMWKFFLVTPIPIASIVLGFVLKKKHYKVTKNIVGGFIMLFLLIIYGSFTFIFSDVYSNDPAYFLQIEKTVGFDFPDDFSISTMSFEQGTDTEPEDGYTLLSQSTVHFNDLSQLEETKKEIENSDKWVRGYERNLASIIPPFYQVFMNNNTYIMVYNTDLKTYNTIPEAEGTYHYIIIVFYSGSADMETGEYTADIIASEPTTNYNGTLRA